MRRRTFLGLLGLLGCKDELEDMKKKQVYWWLNQSASVPLDDDYQAYLDKITALGYELPDTDMQTAQSQFVTDLKTAGLWDRMKTGYLMHSSDKRVNLINLKNPDTYTNSVNAATVLDPLHIKGFGVRSAGAGYYRSPFQSDEYSGIESDLTIIQCFPDSYFGNVAVDAYSTFFRHHSVTTSVSALRPWQTGTNGTVARGGTNKNFTSSSIAGVYTATHTGTAVVIYKDGVKTSTNETATAPNIGTDRGILTANAATTNNGFTASTYFIRILAADFLFDRFTDADDLAFRTAWSTYKDAISLDKAILTESASHCWFASEKAVYDSVSNKSWFGQCAAGYGLSYRQTIYEVNHATSGVTRFQLGSTVQQDDHNEPSIIIRDSDSKLLACYSEHTGTVIRLRVSTNAKDASAWAAETTFNPDATSLYSYPSIFQSASGNIYIFYRRTINDFSANSWRYIKSTNGGTSFAASVHLTDIAYSRIAQDPNNKDLLYFIISRHPDELVSPTHIGSFKMDLSTDKTYLNDGTEITSLMPLNLDDVDQIQTVSSPEGCWLEDIIVDDNGRPRVLFNIIPDNTTDQLLKDEYYSEWDGSAWTTPYKLHRAATHYMETELFATDLLSKAYAPLGTFDRSNPDRIFSGVETSGNFGDVSEIWEINRVSSNSFTRTQKTFNSTHDQWRPFTTGHPSNMNVYWLEKHYYDHWLNEYFQILRYDSI